MSSEENMTDEEIEIQRAELKEELRLAQAESNRYVTGELRAGDDTPASPSGAQLAYENLKAAEVALHDFELDYPAMP